MARPRGGTPLPLVANGLQDLARQPVPGILGHGGNKTCSHQTQEGQDLGIHDNPLLGYAGKAPDQELRPSQPRMGQTRGGVSASPRVSFQGRCPCGDQQKSRSRNHGWFLPNGPPEALVFQMANTTAGRPVLCLATPLCSCPAVYEATLRSIQAPCAP